MPMDTRIILSRLREERRLATADLKKEKFFSQFHLDTRNLYRYHENKPENKFSFYGTIYYNCEARDGTPEKPDILAGLPHFINQKYLTEEVEP